MPFRHALLAGCCLLANFLSSQNFSEVAASLGVSAEYGLGDLGGGVSFADFSGDGVDDLTFTTARNRNLLFYQNTGNGFTQVFPISNTQETKAAVWADYDNDGDQDLFVTGYASADRLYQNNGGSFTDVTMSAFGALDNRTNFGATWCDYDKDGYLDLYVAGYTHPNRLWRGSANGSFVDVAPTLGVTDRSTSASFAACIVDVDGNGWPDIYVINDKFSEPNALFMNDGGTFTLATSAGADISLDAMNAGGGDFDNDGDFDFYVTNTEPGNELLLNDGNGNFVDIGAATGVAVNANCWGANFLDYDNDTDLDLYVSAEHYGGFFYNPFFVNQGDGSFTYPLQLSGGLGGSDTGESFGNAVGDFNGDGRPDIVVCQQNTNFFVWENQEAGVGNFISVQLNGTISNRDGIGARVEVDIPGQTLTRWQFGGEGYLSQNSRRLHFGLGAASIILEVRVHWPSGNVDTYNNIIDLNQPWSFTEGETTLPVSLTEFRAEAVGKAVDLSWATATETGSGHFRVERSTDGTTFSEVGRLRAAGNSADGISYAFRDENPGAGRLYYRLRMVDLDGTEAFSPLRSVWLDGDRAAGIRILRYPANPASGTLSLLLETERPTDGRVEIMDAFGRVVASTAFLTERGNTEIRLGIDHLSGGQYYVALSNNEWWDIFKVIVR